MERINEPITADIIDPMLTLTLLGEVKVASGVRRIQVKELRLQQLPGIPIPPHVREATRIILECPALLIKADIIQGRAAITWPGASTPAGLLPARAADGAHGADGQPLAAASYGQPGNAGGNGAEGAEGAAGRNGADAPALCIAYTDDSSYGTLWVDLRGQDGQPGQDGGHAGNGGSGSQGGPPQLDTWCTGSILPQGYGGAAGAGGGGGDAGNGGNGGCGGYLQILFGKDAPQVKEGYIHPQHRLTFVTRTNGGSGQKPGLPGNGGRPGLPGTGGPALGPCQIPENTLTGRFANAGLPGQPAQYGIRGDSQPTSGPTIISQLKYINLG